MEVGTLRRSKDGLCALCYAKAALQCSKCKQRWYCSPHCQAKDWYLGHKGDCGLGDIQAAPAPAPPARLLHDSVGRPVLSEAAWRRLWEQSLAEQQPSDGSSARPGLPRGLCNLGNNCYMNAVVQGLYHSVPVLFRACREHKAPSGESGTLAPQCSAEAGCFRCDLDRAATECLEHTVSEDGFDGGFELGVRVSVEGAVSPRSGRKRVGIVVSLPRQYGDTPDEDATFGVQFPGSKLLQLPRRMLTLEGRAPHQGGLREVTRWLPKLSEEFTFGQQEDAHEFLRSVLRLVEDEELKAHGAALREEEGGGEKPLEINADLTATPNRMFGGLLVSQCTCTRKECMDSTFSFEPFMDLALDINEATDSIEDALRMFTAPERLDKKNMKRCESCSETVRARKQLMIYTAPPLLAIQLKRFRHEGRGKVTRPVAFSPTLNLRPFLCAGAQEAGKPLIYELKAVVVHLDKAGFSHFGHYTTYVRRREGGRSRWFLLDDSQVFEVPEEEVLSQQAYLLFYSNTGSVEPQPAAARRGAASGSNLEAMESAALPSKCRGRSGAVCSYFACADGLCTRCYQEEHSRPPPAPTAPTSGDAGYPASAPAPPPAPPAARPSTTSKAAGQAAAASNGKSKKVGANDQCPCGSGNKYKKCHGAK